jgi:hypothetical protein
MPDEISADTLRAVLKSQYHAGLAMLREAIEECPADLWSSPAHRNAFWQVAYHALFFTHLYILPGEAAFRPWRLHQAAVQNPDGIPSPPEPGSSLPLIPQPYDRAQVMEYWGVCDGMVDAAVDALDLHSPTSGFPWYRMSKLEHQFVSVRHLQHHVAQLADRLRSATDAGVRWIGGRPAPGA